MMTIQSEAVSELHAGWEKRPEAFRVYFWVALNGPGPSTMPMWESSCYRLVGAAHVTEALEWAELHAEGKRYVVYAEVSRPEGRHCLVQVEGDDPTAAG